MKDNTQQELELLVAKASHPVAERIDGLFELANRIRQNEVLRSLEYDLQARDLAIAHYDNERWALALRNLSDDYMLIGDNATALQTLQECLVLVEPMEDPEKEAGIYLNIGAIHNRMDNDEKARLYFNKALDLFQQTDNQLGIAKCLANIGLVLMDEENLVEAENNFNRSIAIAQKVGARIGEAINMSNLGNLNSKRRNWTGAQELYQQSLEIYTALNNQSGIAATLINLGNVNAELGNFDQALVYLNQALDLNRSLGTKYYEVSVHKNFFEVYEKLGQWQKAFEHHKLYHQLKEEVLSNEAKQKAAEIEMQGKLVIKEKEVELEKLRNVELKQAYNELHLAHEALIEKERMAVHGKLASEIAHEVQNPLQFVNNFAPLNIELLEELTQAMAANDQPEVQAIMNDLQRNCHSIEEHGKRVASIIMQLQLKK